MLLSAPNRRDPSLAQLAIITTCLLILATLAGCGTKTSPEQKEALAKMAELGARINYERGGYEIDLTKTGVEDPDLVYLKQIPNVKRVRLEGTRIGDPGLQHLQEITSLQEVFVQRTRITRPALEKFKKARPELDIR